MEYHWGSQIIDVKNTDLPSLKFNYIFKCLKDNKKISVLEVGSGEGKILKTLIHLNPNLECFGCDIVVPKSECDYKFDLIKGETLPYSNNKFDVVLIVDCLEHVLHYNKYLKEIHRILKNEGIFHCFVPCEGELISAYSFYRLLFGKNLFYKTKNHLNKFKKKKLINLFERFFLIKKINYSYHLLGHIMDATLFALTLNKKVAKLFWNENKYYNGKTKSFRGKLFNKLLSFANAIAYYESKTLKNVKLCAHGLHITSIKK
ncbi:MAG: class I SAM-dependent methyltransferase [Nanoarchaeota archaeon]